MFFSPWEKDTKKIQAEELVNIQVQLSRWELTLNHIWLDEKQRAEIARQAEIWSQLVLDITILFEIRTPQRLFEKLLAVTVGTY